MSATQTVIGSLHENPRTTTIQPQNMLGDGPCLSIALSKICSDMSSLRKELSGAHPGNISHRYRANAHQGQTDINEYTSTVRKPCEKADTVFDALNAPVGARQLGPSRRIGTPFPPLANMDRQRLHGLISATAVGSGGGYGPAGGGRSRLRVDVESQRILQQV